MATEEVNPRFVDIDKWSTLNAVQAMFEGQLGAVAAVSGEIVNVAQAIDDGAARLLAGGRLIYAGAGTSGRIAVQDGVELTPTYGWHEDRLQFVLAGGFEALWKSAEGAEDREDDAQAQVERLDVSERDVFIAVAASGRTKFTVRAAEVARARGAMTVGIANNADTPLLHACEHPLCADTGSELVAGSTRMKAGTAQKAVLNLLSTGMMIRCGRVYNGLMVNMSVSNDKLRERAAAMVRRLSGAQNDAAIDALEAADNDIKLATLIARGWSKAEAVELLAASRDNLRVALSEERR